MAGKTNDLWDFADVLTSELSDSGQITTQAGDVVGEDVRETGVEVWGPPGYYARPCSPAAGEKGAQCLMLTGGDRNAAIGFCDRRQRDIYGNLKPGEFVITAGGEDATAQGKIAGKADGSITLATTDNNTHDGNGFYERLAPDSWSIQGPYGCIKLDATGFHVVLPNGAAFHIVPTSNPASPNAVMIKATQVYIDTPRCQIAPTATNGGKGIALPVVVAPSGSPQTGVPVPIGAGIGVVMGETGSTLTVGV